ncbi:MAG: orotidine-5'-phosphate decarboxylase [Ignavibacteriales bacterium]|nr:orotidine-5'-phosphate decarboxylase [Ignavibacteriales bacterium]
MRFLEKLKFIQNKNKSLLCIGLDTDVSKIPTLLQSTNNPQLEFNRHIIEATSDFACAYKLNLAFYESAGERGYETIHKTLELIPKEIITIADGKRGDIGNTAEQYAKIIFDDWKFDSATVNPYMGKDSIEPFIKDENHCAFILAITSNPGSHDFQYLDVNGRPLYEHVVAKATGWNVKKNIGLVAGATHPDELKRIREMIPEMPLLIPGIGAQKGDMEATIRNGCDKNGLLALINVSRGIIFASSDDNFAVKAREEAIKIKKEINLIREKYFG